MIKNTYTLLETCLDKLDIFEFLTHVENGLKDHYDIKVGLRLVYNNDKKHFNSCLSNVTL